MIELVEEILISRFADLKREEIRKMFRLTDIRRTAVWREAHGEGREEGLELAKQQVARNCLANHLSIPEVAKLVGLPVKEVRRLAKEQRK
jgi:predicted transposase/invertase (TIGR01784 family)